MNITYGAWGFVMATAMLASGCDKKDGGAAGAASGNANTTTTTAAATGVKGTYRGKPWTAKSAVVRVDDENDNLLYLKTTDASCKIADLMGDDAGMISIQSKFKKGLTPFEGDKAFANLFWKSGTGISNTDTSKGEIEWITMPTETTKGVARIKVIKDPDTKIEGSIEVTFCKKS